MLETIQGIFLEQYSKFYLLASSYYEREMERRWKAADLAEERNLKIAIVVGIAIFTIIVIIAFAKGFKNHLDSLSKEEQSQILMSQKARITEESQHREIGASARKAYKKSKIVGWICFIIILIYLAIILANNMISGI